jgi:hypothetical protein
MTQVVKRGRIVGDRVAYRRTDSFSHQQQVDQVAQKRIRRGERRTSPNPHFGPWWHRHSWSFRVAFRTLGFDHCTAWEIGCCKVGAEGPRPIGGVQ